MKLLKHIFIVVAIALLVSAAGSGSATAAIGGGGGVFIPGGGGTNIVYTTNLTIINTNVSGTTISNMTINASTFNGNGAGLTNLTFVGVTTVTPASVNNGIIDTLAPGSTVMFTPGTYTNNNLLRRNLNYGVTGPGVYFEYHHYRTNMTTAEQYAIFDERGVTNGANGTTNTIDLPGAQMRYFSYTNAGTIDYDAVTDTMFFNFNVTGMRAGGLFITNNNSQILFNCDRISTTCFQSPSQPPLPAIRVAGGALVEWNVRIITNDMFGVAYTDSLDILSYTGFNIAIQWDGGSSIGRGSDWFGEVYCFYWPTTGVSTNVDFTLYPKTMTGKIYGDSAPLARWWVVGAQELRNLTGATAALIEHFGGGKGYYDSEVYRTGGGVLFNNLVTSVVNTNNEAWIHGMKVSVNGANSFVTLTPGVKLNLDIDTYEDLGGTINEGFLTASNTTLFVNGGDVQCNGPVIRHNGGRAIYKNLTARNTNDSPVIVTGTGLGLMNCVFVGPANTNTIRSVAARTVSIMTPSSGNNTNHENITLSPNAGFMVDTTLQ
jgi:hypothetical protein